MTDRNEHRNACIMAMAMAFVKAECDASGEPGAWEDEPPDYQRYVIDLLTAAFDALPLAAARVVPVEATEEMLRTGQDSDWRTGYSAYADVWRAMAADGDLTNPPETKL